MRKHAGQCGASLSPTLSPTLSPKLLAIKSGRISSLMRQQFGGEGAREHNYPTVNKGPHGNKRVGPSYPQL
ncbi:MAG: hypothetical protein ACI9HK_003438, partial [Pirellulaceae bacterium]